MIKIGDNVITYDGKKYGRIVEMWYGIIDKCIKVELVAQDGRSYIYRVDELERIDEEDNQMAKLTGYKQVAAIKQQYGTYYYAIYDDGRKYYSGDKVLVSGVANGMVQKIEEIITPEEAAKRMGNKNITAEIISYVDTSAYEERVEKRKAAEKLKKCMDKLIKEMEENNKYEMYAERNPELKEMLETYKKLSV